jgi:hypothetical protein
MFNAQFSMFTIYITTKTLYMRKLALRDKAPPVEIPFPMLSLSIVIIFL